MPWWWPFSKKEELPTAPPFGHNDLACEFFRMKSTNQLQFLWLLGVSNCKKALTNAEPFDNVKMRLKAIDVPEGDEGFEAVEYLKRLKAVCKDGRKHTVVAVLQNIFESKAQSERYADVIEKWKG